MKIANYGRLCSSIFLSLCLLGCAMPPEFETTKPMNLVDRSSIELENYKFFRVANPIDFSSCVRHLNVMCEPREFEAGASYDAVQFSVSIKDRSAWASEALRDYSMYLAGSLSNKLGYEYFTTIKIIDIGTCSTIPSAYSSGQVDSNGYYHGTTTITQDAVCSNLYTVTYLAFKEYDPIKNGILVQYSEDRKPTLHFDLYFGIADKIQATKSGNSGALEYFQHHPIDAWKYYFPSAKTAQAAVAKHGLSPNPDVMGIVQKNRADENAKDLRKELIILGQ